MADPLIPTNAQRAAIARRCRTALAAAVVAAESSDWHRVEVMLEHAQRQVDRLLWRTVKEPR